MHELSVAQAVLDTALRHAGGRPVTAVSVRVGGLRQVVPDSLRFYFAIVARDGDCAGARLLIDEVPARLGCAACATEWDLLEPRLRCPDCGGADVAVLAGEELEVDYIEVTDKEGACIAPR